MAEQARYVTDPKTGQKRYVAATAARTETLPKTEYESEEDKRDKKELAAAKDWERDSIAKRQAIQRADRAARAAAASASPSPSASPAKKAVNPNKPSEPF